jgi:hypothetical protein
MVSLPVRTALSLILFSGALACSPMAPTFPVPAAPAASGVTPSGAIEVGTLTFENLTSNGSAVSEYHERGFTLKFGGAGWVEGHTYGNPRPFVYFKVESGASATGTIEMSGGGQTFAFSSIDLYSSTTKIPYRIVGLRGGGVVFTLDDQLPNTFGQFRTVQSSSNASIDTLRISLTNTAAPCCSNPMGLDNIVVR